MSKDAMIDMNVRLSGAVRIVRNTKVSVAKALLGNERGTINVCTPEV